MNFVNFASLLVLLCCYANAKPDVSHITQEEGQKVIQTIENRFVGNDAQLSSVNVVDPELFETVRFALERYEKGKVDVDTPILAKKSIELKLEDPLILNENYDSQITECNRNCQDSCGQKIPKFINKS